MSGEYIINPLELKAWGDGEIAAPEQDEPEVFRKAARLSQHISYLKDFSRSYKDFTDAQIDTIEIMLAKLYRRFGITDAADFSMLKPENYPVMSDLHDLTEQEFLTFNPREKHLYTEEMLQIEQSEFDLLKYPERGTCLYRCGNERYLLKVHAPEYKKKMFGSAGGR
jgi:hypothetical protein